MIHGECSHLQEIPFWLKFLPHIQNIKGMKVRIYVGVGALKMAIFLTVEHRHLAWELSVRRSIFFSQAIDEIVIPNLIVDLNLEKVYTDHS